MSSWGSLLPGAGCFQYTAAGTRFQFAAGMPWERAPVLRKETMIALKRLYVIVLRFPVQAFIEQAGSWPFPDLMTQILSEEKYIEDALSR